MRRYKVLLPLLVHTEDGSYGQHEIFEKEFTADQEADNLASGLLELQPMQYEVLAGRVHDTDEGDTFTAALPLGNEQQLIEGGLIKPVEPAPAKTTKKKKEES